MNYVADPLGSRFAGGPYDEIYAPILPRAYTRADDDAQPTHEDPFGLPGGGPVSSADRGRTDRLTHLDDAGRARMVDVGSKPATRRLAEAEGRVELDPETRQKLFEGVLPKGEGLPVARIAGIQAAKDTARLIPLCHPLGLTSVEVDFAPAGAAGVAIRATARCVGPTGVEMEALTAVTVAALTVYDMCKGLCRGASIEGVRLVRKAGGRSGEWRAAPRAEAGS